MPNSGRMFLNVERRSSTKGSTKIVESCYSFAFGWILLNERREDVSMGMQQILVAVREDVHRLYLF